jgi:uncharacterized YccA/Bax inhibitor family protein
MNTQTQENIQRVTAMATALVIIGGGLYILVIETLGSFDAASVILGLYVAFWAFVLGSIGLLFSSISLFMRRKVMFAVPTSTRPHGYASIGLRAWGQHRMCAR